MVPAAKIRPLLLTHTLTRRTLRCPRRRGKTAFVSPLHLVDLSDQAGHDDVSRAVLEALALPEGPGEQPVETVTGSLRRRQTLLVLDNCEHVVESAAATCQALVEHCPGVRVLTTSREPLAIGAEQLVPLPPLDPAGAGTELFAQRALALDPDFDLADWREEVTEICRRLDGVPLAIELAAARSRTLIPPQLLDRLQDRLRLLVGGRRDRVERHRTLRATLDRSYNLLTPAERAVFSRLSTFSGRSTSTQRSASPRARTSTGRRRRPRGLPR